MNVAPGKLFEVVPLSAHIGAEIRGLDLSRPLGEATRSAIYQTWLDHSVVIFRDQKLSQEDHIRATTIFGEHAPIRRPPKVLAVGLNYIDHCKEANLPVPPEPVLFTKWSTSVCGPYDDLAWPAIVRNRACSESPS